MSEGITQAYRLSPQQKHLWLLQQHAPGSAFWLRCAVRVNGQIDLQRLERAIYRVVELHEILRTTFPLLPGMTQPVQVVHQESPGSVKRKDLTSLTSEEQNSLIKELSESTSDWPANYDNLPLFRCDLLQLAPDETVMLLKAPAMCADLRSLENVTSQIAACYDSEVEETVSMQYADFAEWHHELLESDEGKPGRQFWQTRELRAHVTTPFESPVGEEAVFRFGIVRLNIFEESAGEQLSRVALACWAVLIQRLNGSSAVTVGKAFDGRTHPELQTAVGPYGRCVPLVIDFIDEHLPMSELLEKLAEVESEAAQWQDYFLWQAVNKPEDYFSVCFEELSGKHRFKTGDITFSIYECDTTDNRFRLKLVSVMTDTSPRLELQYDSSVYSRDDVCRLGDELTTLIANASRSPEAAIGELQSLGDEQRRRIVKGRSEERRVGK